MVEKSHAMGHVKPPIQGGRAQLAYVLLAVYLVGAHLRLTFYSSGDSTLVPNYLMLLSGGILAVAQFDQFKRTGKLLVVLALFVIIQPTITFAPLSGEGFAALQSGLQLIAAIVAALAVLYTTSRLTAYGLRKLFFWAWALLMLTAALENFGLRALIQSAQVALYGGSNRGIYASENRDMYLYGQVRSSAFASEPSFLADSWAATAALVFMLDKNRGSAGSWVRLILMYGLGFALAPSMKVMFYFAAILVWHFWPRTRQALIGLLATLILAGWLLYLLDANVVLSRIASSETGSFFARITVAPLLGAEALRGFPILGYGIGNHEGMLDLMQGVWQSSGGFARFPHFKPAGSQGLMTNGFWWQWAFFGILGGIILSYLLVRMLSSLGVNHPVRSVVCTWIVWYGGFGFIDPASWWILAVFAIPEVAHRVSKEKPSNIPTRPKLTEGGPQSTTAQSGFVSARRGGGPVD